MKTPATINGDINPSQVADPQAQLYLLTLGRKQNSVRASMLFTFIAACVAAFRKNNIPFLQLLMAEKL